MGYKVIYFTRTGTSKRIAEKISAKLSCEAVQVTDNMNWKGVFGFIKGGYYASKKKDVEIKVSQPVDPSDQLVVVSPMWAGGTVPAIRVFLKGKDLGKVDLVLTSNGTAGRNTTGYKSVTNIIRSNKNEDKDIEVLTNRL